MMKRRLTTILLALALSGLAHADTITLNDGTTYEGKVLSEDADSYMVAIQVTASIKDERRILKADVAKIDRSSADDLAFDKIKDLVPTPDRLESKDYDSMIDKQVKAFLEAFPTTKHKKQARTILSTLEKERELAGEGALKLDGRWISAADRESNLYEIDARILLDRMKDAADAGRFQAALQAFEELDRDFSASDSYTKAVELAKSTLDAYGPQVAMGIKRVDTLIPSRTAELELLTPSEREAAYAEIERRDKAYEALLAQEQKSQTKWLSIEQYHKAPMETVLRNIETERKRLDTLKPDEIKKAGATYREAYAAAVAGEQEEATTLFNSLKSIRVPDRYITALEAKLAAKLAETAAPAPGDPVTPEPDPTGTPDDTKPDKTTTTQPGTEELAPGDPKSADDTETGTEEPPVAPREPVAAEEGSPMKTILFIVMAVVLVIALIAVFAGGKKK